jgi:hypothetical protein
MTRLRPSWPSAGFGIVNIMNTLVFEQLRGSTKISEACWRLKRDAEDESGWQRSHDSLADVVTNLWSGCCDTVRILIAQCDHPAKTNGT